MTRGGWRAPLAAALLSWLASSGAVAAAPAGGSYGLDTEAWSSIGYLLVTGGEAKVDVAPTRELDFATLRPSDVVFWLYPVRPLPVDPLLTFVQDGGHLVVADDRGQSGELLRRLGIERDLAGPREHARWYQGLDGLPVARPARDHFLFFNVDEVVTNHPAVLRGAGEGVLTFDDPADRLVVEVRYGRGAVLVVADPSVFLNQMLRRFYGNKQFAANVLRLYCERDPCRVQLALPDAGAAGAYRERSGPLGDLPRIFDDAAQLVNEALSSLSELLSEPPWSWAVAALVLLLGLGLGLWVVATGRVPAPQPDVGRQPEDASPLVQEALGLAAGRGDADFGHLARTLIAQVGAYQLAGLVPAAGEVDARGAPAGTSLVRGALLRLASEADSLQSAEPPMVTAERFLRLYDDVRTVSRYVEERRRAARRPGRRARSPHPANQVVS